MHKTVGRENEDENWEVEELEFWSYLGGKHQEKHKFRNCAQNPQTAINPSSTKKIAVKYFQYLFASQFRKQEGKKIKITPKEIHHKKNF